MTKSNASPEDRNFNCCIPVKLCFTTEGFLLIFFESKCLLDIILYKEYLSKRFSSSFFHEDGSFSNGIQA